MSPSTEEEQVEPAGPAKSRLKVAVKIVFLGFLASVFFGAGALVYVRTALRPNDIARLVVPHVEDALQVRIAWSAARVSWPSIDTMRFRIEGFKCFDHGPKSLVLNVPRLVFDVRLRHLFRGKVLVQKANLIDPTLTLVTSRGPITHRKFLKNPDASAAGGFGVEVRDISVQGGAVRMDQAGTRTAIGTLLLDKIRAQANKITPSAIENLMIKGVSSDGQGAFQIFCGLNRKSGLFGNTSGRLRAICSRMPTRLLLIAGESFGVHAPVRGGLLDADLDIGGAGANYNIRGKAAFHNTELQKGAMFHQDVVIDSARLEFLADLTDRYLNVESFEIVAPGLQLSGRARCQDIHKKDPTLTASVRAADVVLERFFPLIPLNLLSPEDRDPLLQAGLRGRITIAGGTWTGSLSDFVNGRLLNGKVILNAFLENVSGFIPGLRLPLKDASGQARMTEDEMTFREVRLTLGSSPIVLNGSFKDLKGDTRMNLFVSLKAQAQDLRPLLENRYVSKRFSPWSDMFSEPEGGVSVKLTLRGSPKNPKIKGGMDFNGFRCRIKGLSAPLEDVSGAVEFAGSRANLSNLSIAIGDSVVEIGGSLSRDKVEITALGDMAPKDLHELGLLPENLKVIGNIVATLNLEGKPSDTKFAATVDLKDNGLSWSWVLKKKPGVPLTLQASGVRHPESVQIEEAYLILPRTRIAAKGAYEKSQGLTLRATLPPQGILTDELVPLAHPSLELKPGGRIEGGALVKAGPDWSQPPKIDVDATFNHITAQLLGFPHPSSGATGKLRLKPTGLDISLDRARIGNSRFIGKMTITNFARPQIQLRLHSPFLDVSDFVWPPDRKDQSPWSEWIEHNPVVRFLARGKGMADLSVDRLKTEYRTLSDFQGKLKDTYGLLEMPDWKVGFADGFLRGGSIIDIRPGAQVLLRVDYQADHLRMENTRIFDSKYVKVQGDVTADGYVEWRSSSRRENNGVYKTGKMDLRIRDGSVHRFEILSKIFSLINFGSILRGRFPDLATKGLPFRRLTCKAEVSDFKWKFRNVKFISDAAHIDANGMYFADQGRVDFRVSVSPLVGIDTIFSGLFGNLFTKNGKTLTTTFLVRGLQYTPDVRLMPLETFNRE